MVTIGASATDWANDGLFGDGWHLFGSGSAAYAEAEGTYGDSDAIIAAFVEAYGDEDMAEAIDTEAEEFDENSAAAALAELLAATPEDARVTYVLEDEETLELTDYPDTGKDALQEAVDRYLNTVKLTEKLRV